MKTLNVTTDFIEILDNGKRIYWASFFNSKLTRDEVYNEAYSRYYELLTTSKLV
jgi:hypothetical protein